MRTPEAKARLLLALSPGNVDKTKAARAIGLDVGGMSGFDNAKIARSSPTGA